LIRTQEGYSAYRPIPKGQKGLRFHRHSNHVTLTLPHSCFPIAALEFRLGFTVLPGHAFEKSPQQICFLNGLCSSPLAVCDGPVQSSQGTFGWVLVISTPRRTLLQCSGPAYCSYMDSQRAEEYGLLSIITFLHLLETYFKHPLQSTAIWCNNLSLVKTVDQLISRSRQEFSNETLRPR
jgi:hypothetical protein